MRKIYCIGEAVYDIIFKDDKPIEGRPGGAMLNSAISLGRLGMPVYFVGDFAEDHVGRITCDFLKNNGVDTSFVTFYPEARSRIALAFLDSQNNAEYSFYKINVNKPEIRFPIPEKDDIILFGSYFGIKPKLRSGLTKFLELAKAAGSIIIYDPNFRKAHLKMLPAVKGFIDENIRFSSITKGSDEDFHYILSTSDVSKIHHYVEKNDCRQFVYTANRNGVWLFSNDETCHYPAMKVKPISTVGAGDSFNAGMVYSIVKHGISLDMISEINIEMWGEIIQNSIRFASEVCMSFDNYISLDFAKEIGREK